MVGQRLPELPVRDTSLPSGSHSLGPGNGAHDRHVLEFSPLARQSFETSSSEFENFVNAAVELARILTGASASAIAFRGETVTICAARSGDAAPALGAAVDLSSGISRQCLESGKSLKCDDVATDGRVDPETPEAAGIRAVAVVPIYRGDKVSGILGVFSSVPGAFTDLHLERLQELAYWVGSAVIVPSQTSTYGGNGDGRDINLLIPLEPSYRIFYRNLADLLSRPASDRVAESSSQMHGWSDVLVETRLPWKRFFQSVSLHIIVAGMLSGLSAIWPNELVFPRPIIQGHVTYYPVSESFPARASNRPAAQPQTSSPRKLVSPRRPAPARNSETGGAVEEAKIEKPAASSPEIPAFANSRSRGPRLDPPALPPAPELKAAQLRHPQLPNLSVVAPAPELASAFGLPKVNAPNPAAVPPSPDVRGLGTSAALKGRAPTGLGSAGTVDAPIVPPPPSLNKRPSLTLSAGGAGIGVQVVPAPPSLQIGFGLGTGARENLAGNEVAHVVPPPPSLSGATGSLGGGRNSSLTAAAGHSSDGVSQVVPPPPSLTGAGGSAAAGRNISLAGTGGSQVVPPAPSMENGGAFGGRGTGSGDALSSRAVPPPPSIPAGAGDGSGSGNGGNSLARGLSEGAMPPASAEGNPNPSRGEFAEHGSTPSLPEPGADLSHRVYQDLQLRVVALAWAPTRSSYFSNFEVFIAEKRNKDRSEFIKLVYVFLPYQRRLSEYGADALRTRRLRVTRDSSCDEDLMQIMWPEDENRSTASRHSGPSSSPSAQRNAALPCYITSAEDYGRALSHSQ